MAVGSPQSWCFSNFNVLATYLGIWIWWGFQTLIKPVLCKVWESVFLASSQVLLFCCLKDHTLTKLPSAVTAQWSNPSGIWKGFYEYPQAKNRPLEGQGTRAQLVRSAESTLEVGVMTQYTIGSASQAGIATMSKEMSHGCDPEWWTFPVKPRYKQY